MADKSNSFDALKERLAAARLKTAALSQIEREEKDLRDQIAAEEQRLKDERATVRALRLAQELDKAREADSAAVIEGVDLGEEIGVFVLRAPDKAASAEFNESIAANKTATSSATDTLVLKSMIFPAVQGDDAMANALRAKFDRFPYASRTLSEVVLRLGGLRIEQDRRKS